MTEFAEIKETNFDAPHVVWITENGEMAFAEKSLNIHAGCRVIAVCTNFWEADDFCKQRTMKGTQPTITENPAS